MYLLTFTGCLDMSDGGKGDTPRPLSVDLATFTSNWDLIFKKPVATPPAPEERDDDLCDRSGQDAS